MRKGALIVLLIAALIVIAYVGFSSNIFDKLTGRVTYEGGLNCVDSDGGLDYYTKGTTTGREGYSDSKDTTHMDYCFNSQKYPENIKIDGCSDYNCGVQEYFCNSNGLKYYTTALCNEGCKDGACLREGEQESVQDQVEIKEVQDEIKEVQDEIKEVQDEIKDVQDEIKEVQDETEPTSKTPEKPPLLTNTINFFKGIFKKLGK